MRSVFINHVCVHIDMDCGFFPIRKCPLQVFADKNGITCTKNAWNLFDREIRLQIDEADLREKTLKKQIQEVCNACSYGEVQHAR